MAGNLYFGNGVRGVKSKAAGSMAIDKDKIIAAMDNVVDHIYS